MTVDVYGSAKRLLEAARSGAPIHPLSADYPGLTPVDGYAIQCELVSMLLAEGDEIVGYKLGLTSKPMQELLGVNEPDYGPILDSMVVADGDEVEATRFIQPKIEAEIALVLERDLAGPGATAALAAKAVGGVRAALEIIDSRIEDWRIALPDTIADLASSGAVILGRSIVPLTGYDLRLVGMVVSKNGELMATGAGAAALGDPLEALAWLANTLADHGQHLEVGRFVMTGSLHAAFAVGPGDTVRAELDRLGAVSVGIV